MKKAIIFDLDGTLWDSSESCAASWNIILEQHPDISRRITLADMHGFMGKTLDVIAPIALPEVQEPRRMEIMRECVRFELEYIGQHGGVLYPKLRETLELPSQRRRSECISDSRRRLFSLSTAFRIKSCSEMMKSSIRFMLTRLFAEIRRVPSSITRRFMLRTGLRVSSY